MRVAVISDVHGNAAALEAVLDEIEREGVDTIVVGGDVAGGPQQGVVLDCLMALRQTRFVRGNADRVVVEAFDEQRPYDPDEPDPGRKTGAWAAQEVTREQRDFLAGFEDRVVVPVEGLGEVLVCHGSPGSDEEIMTSLTPESALRRMLDGVEQGLVVCGHTHVQFDRTAAGIRIVNTGSVGMPYQGQRGAFWLVLGPDVELRHTEYDYEQAAERIRASEYWDAENHANEILNPHDAREVEEFFEQAAARRGERD